MRTRIWKLIGLMGLALMLVACGDATNTASTGGGSSVSSVTVKSTTAAASGGSDMGQMTPGQSMSGAGSDPMTDSLKGLSGKEFEVTFMQEMLAHHQSALDMAKLIPTNTKRAELLKLGQEITTAQTKEIGDMTGWLASWHNAKPLSDTMSVPGMMAMMGDMDKLKTAKEADFDRQFLQMMTAHHQQALNMAKLVPGKTQRPELLKLSQDILRTQQAEIDQMKGWQKAWFNL